MAFYYFWENISVSSYWLDWKEYKLILEILAPKNVKMHVSLPKEKYLDWINSDVPLLAVLTQVKTKHITFPFKGVVSFQYKYCIEFTLYVQHTCSLNTRLASSCQRAYLPHMAGLRCWTKLFYEHGLIIVRIGALTWRNNKALCREVK